MPRGPLTPIDLIDGALHALGAVLLLAWLVREKRAGRLGNPLADIGPPGPGPALPQLALVVAVYLAALLVPLLVTDVLRTAPAGPPEPGTPAWHIALLRDHAAKLIACLPILLCLRGSAAFRGGARARPRWPALSGYVLSAALIALFVTTVQFEALMTVVRWLDPRTAAALPEHQVLEAFLHDPAPPWGKVHLLVQAALVAPLVEELFFRGLLLEVLWRLSGSIWVAIAASAALFGLVHMSVPQTILPLASMGVILGTLRCRTGSLTACVAAHALFNVRTLALVLVAPELLERGA